ncbi:MAG: glucose-6-phosphate isomerase [Chlamydiae bacterium RIFCSPHIGHO2_12_FULL_49_32]|nr:MAG: glucose-6-phosphate isomerase [Chlamydiae bacterium RIFCSPHIGHO2_12_FULL_49_32]
MYSFCASKSFHRLRELAEEVIDLSDAHVMSPKRVESHVAEALGIKLIYATERVNEVVLHSLFDLAQEARAIEKMEAMQAGEIVNFIKGCKSEERAALHTAMRDFFEQRNSALKAMRASELAYRELEKLKRFLAELDTNALYTDMVQIGIGGSLLGPKAMYEGLKAFSKKERHLHFLSNVDPDEGAALFKTLNLSRTLFVVVSKSGTTLETKTNEEAVRAQLLNAGLDPKNHLIAVTGEKSPMDDPSRYLSSFYIWDFIGGRFSVTSMVGGVALAFALGMDRFLEFLRGASAMDKIALRPSLKENLPLLSALLTLWNRNFLGYPTCAVIPYSAALHRLPAHLQQLEMESHGKSIDKEGNGVHFDTGPIFWGEPGTDGQHSFFQMIHQGTTVIPVHFIGFLKPQYREDILFQGTTCQEKLISNLFAQAIALATGQSSDNPNQLFLGNRPSRILFAEELNPYTLGALLSYFEHHAAFEGFIWNINSFDQEGVQLGKALANRLLVQFAQLREGKEPSHKEFPLGQAFLRHLKP